MLRVVSRSAGGVGIGAGLGVEMSLRQPVSVHTPEIKLPSDEELAKRTSPYSYVMTTISYIVYAEIVCTCIMYVHAEAQRVRLDSMDTDTQREFEDEGWYSGVYNIVVLSFSKPTVLNKFKMAIFT